MGTQQVQLRGNGDEHRAFMSALLGDLRAMECMIEKGMFEQGVQRIGAEQELVLVDEDFQPAPVGVQILSQITDPRVTTEIAKFNLEYNLDPLSFDSSCLRTLHAGLEEVLELVREHALAHNARPLLTGICPTLSMRHLSKDNITPCERYYALDEAITALRGGHYQLRIKGVDELTVDHDSVMLEALNTSFQLHYQVDVQDFAATYNLAQAIAAPLLACSCNSPILFGKRLWRETRIAIFQQAVDTRAQTPHERDTLARVRFGEGWVQSSVLEIYRSDIARFRLLFGGQMEENSLDLVQKGIVPELVALQAHNSTVYRWNRPCYGITDGKPHLRIECRVLPSGPTILDEVANAALWFGLMRGGLEAWPELTNQLSFDDAKANFTVAAHEGLGSQLTWLNAKALPAQELVVKELLPVARQGLKLAGIDQADADFYLDVIAQRMKTLQTGAQWMLSSVADMKGKGTRAERLTCLTAAIAKRQDENNKPVHTWTLASLSESEHWAKSFLRVEQFMTTNLFTVDEDDLIDLVASIMDWEVIRHIPVEDREHRLVGLVSYRSLIKLLAERSTGGRHQVAVKEVMQREPLTIGPETTSLDAIDLMRDNRVACLPVVSDGRLIGIVTEHDFMKMAGQLLEEHLRDELRLSP